MYGPAHSVDCWVVVNSPVGPHCPHKLLLKTILYLFDDGAHPNGQTYPITHIHTVYVCEHMCCCAFVCLFVLVLYRQNHTGSTEKGFVKLCSTPCSGRFDLLGDPSASNHGGGVR